MLGRVLAQAGLLLSLALSASAVPTALDGALPRVMLDKRGPTPPSADPFYKPSAAQLANCQPGDVLNSRQVQVAFWSQTNYGQITDFNQNVQAAYQVLACSRDINGQPSSTVTTIMVPYNAKASPQRLLVFQSAENSASKDCAISYKLLKGSGRGDYDFAIEQILINRELSQGIIVAWTDHEGPDAGFSVGKLAAQAVLDGTRSVLKFGQVIKNAQAVRIAFFGYSGGALATGWAVQEQPVYAPELSSRIVGATYGGPPINPKNTFLHLNKGQAAGVAFAGLAGVGNIYPNTNDYLLEQATDAGKSQLAAFRGPPGYCLVEAVNALQFQDVFTLFKQSQDVLLNAAPIKSVLDGGILGGSNAPSTVPSWPVRIFQAEIDEIVVTADVDNYVSGFCAKGAKVLYVKEYVGEHQSLSITGTPAALAWLDDRFAGKSAGLSGCQTENTASTLISPLAYAVFGQTLLNQLLAIYNSPLGPVLGFGEKRVATQNGGITSLSQSSIMSLINSGQATPSKTGTSSGNSTVAASGSSSSNSTTVSGSSNSTSSSSSGSSDSKQQPAQSKGSTTSTKKPWWQFW